MGSLSDAEAWPIRAKKVQLFTGLLTSLGTVLYASGITCYLGLLTFKVFVLRNIRRSNDFGSTKPAVSPVKG